PPEAPARPRNATITGLQRLPVNSQQTAAQGLDRGLAPVFAGCQNVVAAWDLFEQTAAVARPCCAKARAAVAGIATRSWRTCGKPRFSTPACSGSGSGPSR